MTTPTTLYIGWDVGGWNCDNSSASRDALVVLDDALNVIGMPWRGNLRVTLNDATSSRDLINRLLALCTTGVELGACQRECGLAASRDASGGRVDLRTQRCVKRLTAQALSSGSSALWKTFCTSSSSLSMLRNFSNIATSSPSMGVVVCGRN